MVPAEITDIVQHDRSFDTGIPYEKLSKNSKI
jgi:hypothetical protein